MTRAANDLQDVCGGQEPRAVPLRDCSQQHVEALQAVFRTYACDNQLADGTQVSDLTWPSQCDGIAEELGDSSDDSSEAEEISCECSGAACEGDRECECIETFGHFYTSSAGIAGDESTEKVVNVDALAKLPLVECGTACSCSSLCANRLTQRGVSGGLELRAIGKDVALGLGLFTTQRLCSGHFVCLYAGEWLDTEQARARWTARTRGSESSSLADTRKRKRRTEIESSRDETTQKVCMDRQSEDEENEDASPVHGGNYILSVRENGKTLGHVDPTVIGNIGRFINHSCDPNLILQTVRWGHRAYPRIAVFTRREVDTGEELRYDYGDAACSGAIGATASPLLAASSDQVQPRTKCECGASNCRGLIPFDASL